MAPGKAAADENMFGGSWSMRKLECVQSYLDAYLKVMLNQSWADLWYIDAFSGDGMQKFKPTTEFDSTVSLLEDYDQIRGFTDGSALRA